MSLVRCHWLAPLAMLIMALVPYARGESPGETLGIVGAPCPRGFVQGRGQRCYLGPDFYPMGGDGSAWKRLPATQAYEEGLRPERIALGRLLFFDPILSQDGSQSCAHCHRPDRGFADGRAVSVGIARVPLARGAPSLWNVGFESRLFWDGRASSLEAQAEGPLFSPHEMGQTREGLVSALEKVPAYPRLFREAFPDARDGIRVEHVVSALADFQRTLVSLKSPYDRYIQGDAQALTEEEIQGFNVFRSFVSRCSECHVPPLLTNGQLAVIGVPTPEGHQFDVGALASSGELSQKGAFKVPTLRNIAKTAPYMHAGSFATLDQVLRFYNQGGGRGPDGEREDLRIHWHIRPMSLKEEELGQLASFLGALTDESLMPCIPRSVPSGRPVIKQDFVTTKSEEEKKERSPCDE